MAEMQMTGHGNGPTSAHGFTTMANWAGAAVSMALLVGVGVWGYKLIMRDVSGVPVVRAAEGPMRVAPDNPGGSSAAHQGLAVNQIAGTGTSAPPPDQLTLAPRPLDLAQEDAPQPMLSARADRASDRDMNARLQLAEDSTAAPGSDSAIQSLADQIAADAAAKLNAGADGGGAALEVEEAAAAPRFPGSLTRSLRPRLRPQDLRAVSLAAVPVSQTVTELSPETIATGTPVVQLGAFDSAEIARAEWDRLSGRFSDFLEDKSRVVQKANSGGRTFYRLRAHGFVDINDARRLCAALQAGRAECIPVTTR
ncbi:SPOR domain-containing protein [Primorskyibacter flagellatus]|uniref:Sporulation related domain-containing protein n=1 Tax=Primorskyibacter flagellatus TaxID=1387277 RepID=A0A1W1YZF8_9RHOB|nr:SPOR domain-containing protein [Primorskyibacter flagellatus]SMC41472.1 Sporulation related domain-containing protein [Primorskyibacter flagellatus]